MTDKRGLGLGSTCGRQEALSLQGTRPPGVGRSDTWKLPQEVSSLEDKSISPNCGGKALTQNWPRDPGLKSLVL